MFLQGLEMSIRKKHIEVERKAVQALRQKMIEEAQEERRLADLQNRRRAFLGQQALSKPTKLMQAMMIVNRGSSLMF